MKYTLLIISFIFSGSLSLSATATKAYVVPKDEPRKSEASISEMIDLIRKRSEKFNWDLSIFVEDGWQKNGLTVNKLPLIYWTCGESSAKKRALILSAVHGDEVTPVYFGFRVVEWIKARPQLCKDQFIVVAPIVNPDGFLRYQTGTRTNYNKVDLNRNFKTPEWEKHAIREWKTKYASQRRYFPGDKPDSEPETHFQKWLIDEFKPQKIVSVHSPLNALDYDGPESSPEFTPSYKDSCDRLKNEVKKATPELRLFAFGTYPGSLGNYAGKHLSIPTFTAELPTADAKMAGAYFSMMEKGLKVMLEYDLPEHKVTQK